MAAGSEPLSVLLIKAQQALAGTRTSLGSIMGGLSRKTISKYQDGNGRPHPTLLHPLVRRVYPVDPALAEKLAAFSGATLGSLGLVTPVSPAPQAPPPPPPAAIAAERAPDERHTRLFVDAVLCAAANALDVSPRTVRGVLFAAFSQAKETGLSFETLAKALAPSKAAAGRRTRTKRKR
jgi:hypothetical protein